MPEETIKIVTDLMKLANESDTEYLNRYNEIQIMVHCAEEMAECSSALDKLVRILLDGPASLVGEREAREHMIEELADAVSMGYILMRKLGCVVDVAEIHLNKSTGFVDRIVANE